MNKKDVCPSCGYCKACGQKPYQAWYPYTYSYIYPWYTPPVYSNIPFNTARSTN